MTGKGIAIYSFSESEWDSALSGTACTSSTAVLYYSTTELRGLQHAARVQELLLCVHKATHTRNLRKIRGSKTKYRKYFFVNV